MWFNLLAEAEGNEGFNWAGIVPIIIIIALLVAFFVWSYVSQKKKQKQFNETVSAVKPGSKVKTIGGVVGEVVEVNDADDTFVLKTGSEGNYSYMRFDKQAIYQTDAKPEAAAAAAEPIADEEPAQAPSEPFEEKGEAQAEESSDKAEEKEDK